MQENLIPEIDKKIEKKLKELELKPRVSPKQFIKKTEGKKHRFVSICQDKNEKPIVFCARLHKNPDAKRKVKKEVLFARALKNKQFKKKLAFSRFLPWYFNGKIEKDFEWFLREYIPKAPLGKNKRLVKKLSEKDIESMALALYKISKASLFLFKNIPLKRFTVRNYVWRKKDLDWLVKENLIEDSTAKKLARFARENYHLLSNENRYFSHGDFNLGNLIKTNNGLKIIDWESMGINNFAFDIAYLFTHLWQASKYTRKNLVKKYISFLENKKIERFKTLFQIAIIDLGIEGICANPREISPLDLKKRRIFFQNLLINASENFEKIINT